MMWTTYQPKVGLLWWMTSGSESIHTTDPTDFVTVGSVQTEGGTASFERTNSEQDSERDSQASEQNVSPAESEYFSADPEYEAEQDSETQWFALRR